MFRPKRETEIGWLRLWAQNGVSRHIFGIHLQPGHFGMYNPCLIRILKNKCSLNKIWQGWPRWQQFRSAKSYNLNYFWKYGQSSSLLCGTKQWSSERGFLLSYISHDFASKATTKQQPAHRGVGQTLQGIVHNNGTLRARPSCRTKKPGIQLMRLNAGRLGWKFWKVLVEADSSSSKFLRWEWFLPACKLPECTFLAFSGNVRLYWLCWGGF